MRLGTDIIEIQRIALACERNALFPSKILSQSELDLYESMPQTRRFEFLAGRFSAKEAYAKALGTGIGRLKFTDLTILPDYFGKPILHEGPIVENVLVSISHCKEYATATVIINAEKDEVEAAINRL
ncbi:holo-ACP synthase [Aerococcaceae bacterium zg-ZJ1578]|uniref:holo-ACP synthase n=1 Tax=Aerococcaceae TaxID=186827 RepID=UPI0013B973E8|nr:MULTISPECIES: holo-ACP synthase [unclassified Facklamia]MBK0348709.1 holo-ACP synthase [Aerococcaceae bacterium zg-1578]MBR7926786.1 holo-ACP synthase [Aerococcaceae bacterium zg-ZUI334]QQD65376.1 holo-ACP synthase [Aerococcaceae bacterium zg-252]NEW64031.1 holo-[acyl-carrier-protein] synthase [Facklamia sp. 252]NEW68822.1 holo-[acyl-carrier-protein] synthase [Facklamia sp. 253]